MADKVYETFNEWHVEVVGYLDIKPKLDDSQYLKDRYYTQICRENGWNARQPQVDALTAQVEALKEQNENLERNVTGKHRHIRKLEESLKGVMQQLTATDAACATALMNKLIDALEDWADLDDDQRTARAAEALLLEALTAWKLAKGGA
jgi:predicted RNase H-like nuclease (RuvC/YqgF family)